MTDIPRSEEALHRKFLIRQITHEADRYRDLAARLDRFATQAEAPRQVPAAEFYSSLAGDLVKEVTTTLFNSNFSLIVAVAGQVDVARAKGI